MASPPEIATSTPDQDQSAANVPLRSLLRLRTIVGFVLFCATLLFTFGASWDITSHRTVGRDATFTPAHVTMLTALTITGLAAMILVLIETGWARRYPSIRNYGIPFAGGFTGPMGAYLAGFGAVTSAIAFPLDNYWHSLYGIDTSLWAPFHVMIFLGATLSALGTTYLFISTAHLAVVQRARMLKYLCTGAAMIVLADLTQKLVGIVDPALTGQGLISLPFGSFDLYPVMIAASLMIGFSAAIFAFPRLWGATIVALIRTGISAILGIVIPPVMAWQIQFEHETLLPRAAQAVVRSDRRSTFLMFAFLLVLALLLDGIAWYARRRGWTLRTSLRALFFAAFPLLLAISLVGLATFQGQEGRHRLSAVHNLGGLGSLGLATVLLSLVLLPVGELIGQWFGKIMGQSLKTEKN
jgi:hypothetical protein